MTRTTSRRTVIKGIGAAIAATTVPAVAAAESDDEWTAVESPTDNTLHDVADTRAGAFAVGAGGIALERTDTGGADLRDVTVNMDDDTGIAVGGGGVVVERSGGTWSGTPIPTGANLKAVVDGSPAIAVGAGGTIVER